AEDGIRDRNVTGVQTCALPIYRVDVEPVRAGVHPVGLGDAAALLVRERRPRRPGALTDQRPHARIRLQLGDVLVDPIRHAAARRAGRGVLPLHASSPPSTSSTSGRGVSSRSSFSILFPYAPSPRPFPSSAYRSENFWGLSSVTITPGTKTPSVVTRRPSSVICAS